MMAREKEMRGPAFASQAMAGRRGEGPSCLSPSHPWFETSCKIGAVRVTGGVITVRAPARPITGRRSGSVKLSQGQTRSVKLTFSAV